MPWVLIELFIVAILLTFFITQMFIPSLIGRPWFPAFRWRKVNKRLAQEAEEQDLAEYTASEGEKHDDTPVQL